MTRITPNRRRRFFFAAVCLAGLFPLFPESATTGAAAQPNQSVSLAETAKKIGADLYWDPLNGSIALTSEGHLVSCRVGEPLVFFDYSELALMDPPSLTDAGLAISLSFANRLDSFFKTLPAPVAYRVGAILIDPGHGGKDPGAIGQASLNGKMVEVREKDVVLTVAKDLYNRLTKAYPDKKILLTRSGDTYPSLEDRVEMANSVKLGEHEAILYLSIHANSAFNKDSSGFEVWYLTPDYRRTVIDKTDEASSEILPILNTMMEEEFTTESILIAKSVMDELNAQIGSQSRNRGLKAESWFVVRNARMPSVLVELGFVSNPAEAKLLSNQEYLKKCSLGLYNGLVSFITNFEGSRGFTGNQ